MNIQTPKKAKKLKLPSEKKYKKEDERETPKALESQSNHYQFHAISLTSFSNISSIPISTRRNSAIYPPYIHVYIHTHENVKSIDMCEYIYIGTSLVFAP